jgi:predicted DNA-binding transcriptional regulator AlpA
MSKPKPPSASIATLGIKLLRRPAVLELLGVHNATLSKWVADGHFLPPVVLNPGGKREIVAWPEDEVRAWLAAQPRRMAQAPLAAQQARREKHQRQQRSADAAEAAAEAEAPKGPKPIKRAIGRHKRVLRAINGEEG